MVRTIQELVLFEPTKGDQKIKGKMLLEILPILNSIYGDLWLRYWKAGDGRGVGTKQTPGMH